MQRPPAATRRPKSGPSSGSAQNAAGRSVSTSWAAGPSMLSWRRLRQSARGHPLAPGQLTLAHAFNLIPADLVVARKLGISISVQPLLAYVFEHEMIAAWGDVAQLANPYRAILEAGVPLAGGSDVLPCEPLRGAAYAVNRRSREGAVLGADQAIAPDEALALFTERRGRLPAPTGVRDTHSRSGRRLRLVARRPPLSARRGVARTCSGIRRHRRGAGMGPRGTTVQKLRREGARMSSEKSEPHTWRRSSTTGRRSVFR